MSERQKNLLGFLYPKVQIATHDTQSIAQGAMDGFQRVALEIGFGSGEHLIAQAQANPACLYLGVEPFVDGMAKILAVIEETGLSNIRLHLGDVRDILPLLDNHMLNRVFILFPDPWPKKRHNKRRLVNAAFVEDIVLKTKSGGRIRFATDVKDYANCALADFTNHVQINWTAQRQDDWLTPPDDHVTTRYEKKRLGDINPVYFDFIVKTP